VRFLAALARMHRHHYTKLIFFLADSPKLIFFLADSPIGPNVRFELIEILRDIGLPCGAGSGGGFERAGPRQVTHGRLPLPGSAEGRIVLRRRRRLVTNWTTR
jgi:hypothetical protein